jgi:hypothetical protein
MARQMITIYVGDVTEYLSEVALNFDPTATLLTYDLINNISPGTYYTNIGDVGSLANFAKVLRQADQIVYMPPTDNWSDNSFGKSKMKMWTEDYLKAFSHYKPIENFSMDPVPKVLENKSIILKLSDVRKTSQPQLWVSGCSFAAGDGVQSNQRYGQILSDRLNLPVSFLAESGSSVTWAADQILRSDLRENDILIWGLTSIPRINYFKNNKVHHVFPGPCEHIKNFQKILVDSEEDILYKSLAGIYQVMNFCEKIKVDLFLVNLLQIDLQYYLKDDIDVLSLVRLWGRDPDERYEDLGDDHRHPGIKTHEFYATEILKKIKERRKNGRGDD